MPFTIRACATTRGRFLGASRGRGRGRGRGDGANHPPHFLVSGPHSSVKWSTFTDLCTRPPPWRWRWRWHSRPDHGLPPSSAYPLFPTRTPTFLRPSRPNISPRSTSLSTVREGRVPETPHPGVKFASCHTSSRKKTKLGRRRRRNRQQNLHRPETLADKERKVRQRDPHPSLVHTNKTLATTGLDGDWPSSPRTSSRSQTSIAAAGAAIYR